MNYSFLFPSWFVSAAGEPNKSVCIKITRLFPTDELEAELLEEKDDVLGVELREEKDEVLETLLIGAKCFLAVSVQGEQELAALHARTFHW